jgi:hypothetical protein
MSHSVPLFLNQRACTAPDAARMSRADPVAGKDMAWFLPFRRPKADI